VTSCDGDKNCVADKCASVFSGSGMEDLYDGCMFYVEWFEAADNPQLRYEEVSCPSELSGRSGL
jgi:hypothetical protein